jgi:hypothetical protein
VSCCSIRNQGPPPDSAYANEPMMWNVANVPGRRRVGLPIGMPVRGNPILEHSGSVALVDACVRLRQWWMRRSHARLVPPVPSSAFKGFRFPPEVIVLAVRWYLRFGLSYRDVEELLASIHR